VVQPPVVAGRGARFEVAPAQRNSLGGLQIQIGAFRAARRRDRDAAASFCLKEPGAGDVVGVHVRLERELEAQASSSSSAASRRAARTPGR